MKEGPIPGLCFREVQPAFRSGTGTLNHIGTSLGYDVTSGIYTRQVQGQAPAAVCSIRAIFEALGPHPLQVFFATVFSGRATG
jgi:hypothetical protein